MTPFLPFCPPFPPADVNAPDKCYDMVCTTSPAESLDAAALKIRDSQAGQWQEFHYMPHEYCVDDLVGTVWCWKP